MPDAESATLSFTAL
jgi:hypothetical protein